nr:MAG TPA: hypothetical protein [Caudoviricetes sp.]
MVNNWNRYTNYKIRAKLNNNLKNYDLLEPVAPFQKIVLFTLYHIPKSPFFNVNL